MGRDGKALEEMGRDWKGLGTDRKRWEGTGNRWEGAGGRWEETGKRWEGRGEMGRGWARGVTEVGIQVGKENAFFIHKTRCFVVNTSRGYIKAAETHV